ncbi:hypothetical protein AB0F17_58700 [Nonomuraea sp. NPDC026600]|uniref:hypothetical protein n=1 Tax=Nonomuraea sp. NPDC026600 TaxID=3155363 RepID=UPI00341157ED
MFRNLFARIGAAGMAVAMAAFVSWAAHQAGTPAPLAFLASVATGCCVAVALAPAAPLGNVNIGSHRERRAVSPRAAVIMLIAAMVGVLAGFSAAITTGLVVAAAAPGNPVVSLAVAFAAGSWTAVFAGTATANSLNGTVGKLN